MIQEERRNHVIIFNVILGAILLFTQSVVPFVELQPSNFALIDEADAGTVGTLSPNEAKQVIAKKAQATVLALKNKDTKALQRLAHPKKGIRFTPYATVDLKNDIVFNRASIAKAFEDQKVYEWGVYDGIGGPIKLTFADYYKTFIFNRDYSRPERVGYNEVVEQGNSIINIREVYPSSVFVEYNFSQNMEGNIMGWSSLRLVFEKHLGKWYLIGIIHDEWTI